MSTWWLRGECWLACPLLRTMRRSCLPTSEFLKALSLGFVGCLRTLSCLTLTALVQRSDDVLGRVHSSLLIHICWIRVLNALSLNPEFCWFPTLLSKSHPIRMTSRTDLSNVGVATKHGSIRDNWRVITVFPVEWCELAADIQVWWSYLSNSTKGLVGISALFLGE